MWLFRKKAAPYTLSTEHWSCTSPISYKLFDCTRNSDKKEFCACEIRFDQSPFQTALGQNAIKNWKAIRHPVIPVFLDSFDDSGATYIITHRLLPFDDAVLSDAELSWAIYVLADFVGFLNDDANAIHGSIGRDSLFMTPGHELKVAGLHWLTIGGSGPLIDFASAYSGDPSSADLRAIATLANQWRTRLPPTVTRACRRFTTSKISARSLLAIDHWKSDKFVQYLLVLRDLALKDEFERESFFRALTENLGTFSKALQVHVILPALMSALSYVQSSSILEVIIGVGEIMEKPEFGSSVVPNLVPLFNNKDRNLRVQLLSQIEKLLPYLSPSQLNDKIFGQIATGLSDAAAPLRAATIVAMCPTAQHLNTQNGRTLLRELKRLQGDPEASIRCNAVICIAKIADTIEQENRAPYLVQAIAKAAGDTAAIARRAAVNAWKSCLSHFSPYVVATAVMPALAPLCADAAIEVKVAAIKLMRHCVDVLSEGVPELEEAPAKQEAPKRNVQIKITAFDHDEEKQPAKKQVQAPPQEENEEEEGEAVKVVPMRLVRTADERSKPTIRPRGFKRGGEAPKRQSAIRRMPDEDEAQVQKPPEPGPVPKGPEPERKQAQKTREPERRSIQTTPEAERKPAQKAPEPERKPAQRVAEERDRDEDRRQTVQTRPAGAAKAQSVKPAVQKITGWDDVNWDEEDEAD
jgi:hypothetical protein